MNPPKKTQIVNEIETFLNSRYTGLPVGSYYDQYEPRGFLENVRTYEPIRTAVRTFLLGTNRHKPKIFWKVRTGTNRAGKMLGKGIRKKISGEKFFDKIFFSCQIQKKVILLTD